VSAVLPGSMLVEFAFQSLPKSSDIGNNGGTDENMAELEEELGFV